MPSFACVCFRSCFKLPTRIYVFPESVPNKEHTAGRISRQILSVYCYCWRGSRTSLMVTVNADPGDRWPGLQLRGLLLAGQAGTSLSRDPPLCFRPRKMTAVSPSLDRQVRRHWMNTSKPPGARADPQQRLATTSADMGFPFPFVLSPTLRSLSTSLYPSLLNALPQSCSHPSLKHLHHSLQQTLIFLGISSCGNRFETLRPWLDSLNLINQCSSPDV